MIVHVTGQKNEVVHRLEAGLVDVLVLLAAHLLVCIDQLLDQARLAAGAAPPGPPRPGGVSMLLLGSRRNGVQTPPTDSPVHLEERGRPAGIPAPRLPELESERRDVPDLI